MSEGISRGFYSATATKILRRDGYTCVYCGNIADVIDHVVPYSKGGKTIKANGVACCNSCNMKKKGKLLEEYLVKGMVHLVRVGEDVSWTDTLYDTKRHKEAMIISGLYQMTAELLEAANLLLQCDISRSETCSILRIDEGALNQILGGNHDV